MKVGRMERRHFEVTVVTVKQVWSTAVYAFTPWYGKSNAFTPVFYNAKYDFDPRPPPWCAPRLSWTSRCFLRMLCNVQNTLESWALTWRHTSTGESVKNIGMRKADASLPLSALYVMISRWRLHPPTCSFFSVTTVTESILHYQCNNCYDGINSI